MKFDDAKKLSKEGHIVARTHWDNKYLTIETAYEVPYVCRPQGGSKLLSYLTAEDVNADDWTVRETQYH